MYAIVYLGVCRSAHSLWETTLYYWMLVWLNGCRFVCGMIVSECREQSVVSTTIPVDLEPQKD